MYICKLAVRNIVTFCGHSFSESKWYATNAPSPFRIYTTVIESWMNQSEKKILIKIVQTYYLRGNNYSGEWMLRKLCYLLILGVYPHQTVLKILTVYYYQRFSNFLVYCWSSQFSLNVWLHVHCSILPMHGRFSM